MNSNTQTDEWAEWREQCRAQLRRPVSDRIRYGWVRVKPLVPLPQDTYRSFQSMDEYRLWCEAHYPKYYGYWRRPKTEV